MFPFIEETDDGPYVGIQIAIMLRDRQQVELLSSQIGKRV
jgi:putative lipoic acid-binding regulatory protein